MKKNRLLIATGVLVALLALTVWKLNRDESEQYDEPHVEAAIPSIEKDDIDELEVARPGKDAVVLAKKNDAWRVIKPVAAEADKNAVDTALNKLAELEVTGVAATKEMNHSVLEVTDDKAIRVVPKQGGKPLAELLVGAYRSGNTMVRKQGAVPVASIRGSIRWVFDKEIKDWRNRSIVEVGTDEVTALSLVNGRRRFRFVKEGSAWAQAAGEKPIKRFDASKVQSLVSSLSHLQATDFADATEVSEEKAGVGPAGTVAVTLKVQPKPAKTERPKPAQTAAKAGEQDKTSEVAKEGQAKAETKEPPPPYEIRLRVGGKTGSDQNNRYVKREGNPVIYVVSEYLAERMLAEASKFAKEPASDEK
ncbi:MAG: DUF4340 domain-containing protein [Proteobacteria bacterium]|nr:DUF4340 domain-containing protein [Pseudomonadota bacterium]